MKNQPGKTNKATRLIFNVISSYDLNRIEAKMEKLRYRTLRIAISAETSKVYYLNRIISLLSQYNILRKLRYTMILESMLMRSRQKLNSLVKKFVIMYADFPISLKPILKAKDVI